MENEFADNRVMVVLTNEASLNYLQTETFETQELSVGHIESFTSPRGKQIKAMVDERKNASLAERLFTSDPNADEIADYREVLCIELEERSKEKVLEVIAILEQREDVLYVGPDYAITACADDSSDAPQLDYLNQTATIDLPQAQSMITDPEPVRVAVLDTGIDAGHEVLSHFVITEKSQNYVVSENSGELQNAHITDPNGHGTHVAGIIVATAVNVELISLRVLDSNNDGYSSYVENAIEKVIELWNQGYKIPIINLSARWVHGSIYYDIALNVVIQQYQGLFVCGAGNENKYIKEYQNSADDIKDSITVYPASFDFGNDDRMLVVGASNQADNGLWIGTEVPGSNYGKLTVDIFAPGESILSCYPSDLCEECFDENGELINLKHVEIGYHSMSGTSMATPFVTGVAALILSVHPDLEAEQLKECITDPENVDNLYDDDGKSVLKDLCTSGGRLNAYKALYASHSFGAWAEYGEDGHRHTCTECGYTETTEHSYSSWKTDVYGCKSRTCSDCGYVQNQHKQSSRIIQNDDSTHVILYPCCNTGIPVAHTWSSWVDVDTTYHRATCSDCGYEQLQYHTDYWNSAKNMCMACKRTGPVSGGTILRQPIEEKTVA